MVADGHRLEHVGEELQLVLDVLGREQGAVGQAADILGAVDDLQVPGIVEEAGVAGPDPAVGGLRRCRRLGVLVVGVKHPGRAEQYLAIVRQFHLDVFDRRAHRIRTHLVVELHGDEGRCLGLAVDLLQVDADGSVEVEHVRADGLAGGIGQPRAAVAELVLQRFVDHDPADGIADAIGQRRGLAGQSQVQAALGHVQEVVEHPALEAGGVFHADHDAGAVVFQHPRRGEVVGRPDLAGIVHYRFRAFRAAHAEAGNVCLGIGNEVVDDPRHRQVGDDRVGFVQPLQVDADLGNAADVVVGEHDTLGLAGSAGGVEDHRGVLAAAKVDFLVDEARVRGDLLAAPGLHRREAFHQCRVISGQAAVIIVDDAGDIRAAVADLEHLVHLLLVLGHHEACLGVADDELHFLGHGVVVGGYRDTAQALGGGDGDVQARAVLADDEQLVAALEAQLRQAGGKAGDLVVVP